MATKPTSPVSSWQVWVEADGEWQTHVFKTTGKRPPRLDPPNASIFPSDDIYKAALENRLILCDKEDHVGDRLLTKDKRYGLSTCKACKCAAKMRKARANAPAPRIFETADEWFHEVAPDKSATHTSIVGYCPVPVRASFVSDAEFERAQVLRDERFKLYHHQYGKLPDAREKDNKAHRERYDKKKKARVENSEDQTV